MNYINNKNTEHCIVGQKRSRDRKRNESKISKYYRLVKLRKGKGNERTERHTAQGGNGRVLKRSYKYHKTNRYTPI